MNHQRPSSRRHRFLLTAFCLLPSVFLCLQPSAFSQSATATLSGTVVDQNGAAIPGVSITVLNAGTSLQREVSSNDQGYFVAPLLSPGTYQVRARRDGFAPLEIPNVVLNVGDQKGLQIQLKAGDVNAAVTVDSTTETVRTDGSVGTVVDRQFVENIPLNGRSLQSLINLAPGIVVTPANLSNQGQFSVNGQRADANYFTVDGVSANVGINAGFVLNQSGGGSLPGLNALGGTNNLVSIDALQEFRIQTSSFAPEFGRTPGGQIQILTRSGTNDFHGTLFEYFRNEVLDATDWFANANRLPKTALRQNDFGGVFGGPLYLPRFGEGGQSLYSGKNRTFFFFSYEGLRLRLPQTMVTQVPSLRARGLASAQTRPLLDAYALPNGVDLGNGFARLSASFSTPATLNATSIRIDHAINERMTLFGRYNYAPSESVAIASSFGTPNNLQAFSTGIQTLTLGSTQLLSPAVSNELLANYSRTRGGSRFILTDFGGAVPPDNSIPFPSGISLSNGQFGFFTLSPFSNVALGTPSDNLQRQVNVVDNLTMQGGTHGLKFGLDYRRLTPFFGPNEYQQSAAFSNLATMQAGVASTISVVAVNTANIKLTNLSLYGQDSWSVSPRLTLTYGLRWDVNTPPVGIDGYNITTVVNLDDPVNLALSPPGTPLYKTTYNNFGPRIGLAYRLSQKKGEETVLRGGFGVFYDLGTGVVANATTTAPNVRVQRFFGVPYPLPPALSAPPRTAVPPFQVRTADPEVKLPYTLQWNLTLERSLGTNQAASVAYVGAVGRRLLRNESVLVANNPNFNGISLIRNTGTSDYNALQLQFRRRLSRGLRALASYTWAKSLDNGSSDADPFPSFTAIDPASERGPSDFDVRHAFNAAVTYNLPSVGRGAFSSVIFRGWSVDTIFAARSATPVNVNYNRSIGIGFDTLRPDLVSGIPLYINDPAAPGGRRINNTSVTIPGNPLPQIGPFLRPVEARQGTLGRNALRGFPVSQVDLALRRQFDLTERINLQFRAEFFNFFNHPNFANPESGLNSGPLFGLSNRMLGRGLGSSGGSGLNPLYQIGGPRSAQFALKLVF